MEAVHVVAGVWIDQGRVLAVQRGPGGAAAGLWEFPGGKVEAGESAAQALARELHEELGLEAVPGASLGTVWHRWPGLGLRLEFRRVGVAAGEPELRVHSALRWLAAGELGEVDWAPADRPILGAVEALLGTGQAGGQAEP